MSTGHSERPPGSADAPWFRAAVSFGLTALVTFVVLLGKEWPWRDRFVWVLGFAVLAFMVTIITDRLLLKSRRMRVAANIPGLMVLALMLALVIGPTPYIVGGVIFFALLGGLLSPPIDSDSAERDR